MDTLVQRLKNIMRSPRNMNDWWSLQISKRKKENPWLSRNSVRTRNLQYGKKGTTMDLPYHRPLAKTVDPKALKDEKEQEDGIASLQTLLADGRPNLTRFPGYSFSFFSSRWTKIFQRHHSCDHSNVPQSVLRLVYINDIQCGDISRIWNTHWSAHLDDHTGRGASDWKFEFDFLGGDAGSKVIADCINGRVHIRFVCHGNVCVSRFPRIRSSRGAVDSSCQFMFCNFF